IKNSHICTTNEKASNFINMNHGLGEMVVHQEEYHLIEAMLRSNTKIDSSSSYWWIPSKETAKTSFDELTTHNRLIR
ncbi:6509_t:CDS:2, partial [Funneliformis mosseae]